MRGPGKSRPGDFELLTFEPAAPRRWRAPEPGGGLGGVSEIRSGRQPPAGPPSSVGAGSPALRAGEPA
eukprot:10708161-Alexandrium_andersonii.AAC.1